MPAIDIVRHLLPDLVVTVTLAVSLGVAIKVAQLHKDDGQSARSSVTETEESSEGEATELTLVKAPPKSTPTELTPIAPQNGSNVQLFIKIPLWFVTVFDIIIFGLLLLSGVAVVSITSLFYYSTFLTLLILWSLHRNWRLLIRILRIITLVYVSVHILVLYLYQFQSMQLLVPVLPLDTTDSLVARYVAGL